MKEKDSKLEFLATPIPRIGPAEAGSSLTQDLASAAVGGESESVGPKGGLTLAETTTTEVGMIKTKMKRRRGAFQGQCADYASHKAGDKSNKLCGYSWAHPPSGTGESNANCGKQHGSGGGGLDSEGEGAGLVPFSFAGGYSSCYYQGYFAYPSQDGYGDIVPCRKACDRVQHCKYFAHNSGAPYTFGRASNYCTLFNGCQTWAADTNVGWAGGVSVQMFKCKPGCTMTGPAELPSCQETPCLNTAGWKDKDPKTGLYCDSSDSSCEHDCCEPLSACASSHCVAENGWTPKQNITDLFCDATGDADANTCQEDCCDKLPDCSTDYGTDASCNEVAPPAPQLWARKTEAQAELYCAGDSCTREECCNGVCDSSFCGTELVLNSTAATVRCEGVACNVTVCCVQKPATVDARTDSDRENGAGDASAVQLGEEDLIEERRVREK
eukprot:g6440.t1